MSGCTSWSPAGSCEHLSTDTLRLWLPGTGANLQLEIDGAPRTVTPTAAGTGVRLSVPLPAQGRRLELRRDDARFLLPLTPIATATPSEPKRREAFERFAAGRGEIRAGRMEAGRAELDRAEAMARAAKDDHRLRDAALLGTYIDAVFLGRFEAARACLERLPEPRSLDGRARILTHYHRGLLASRVLDARTALRELEEAERWARRLASPHLVAAAHERARVLADVGDHRRAAAVLDRLLGEVGPNGPACTRAALATSAGWARTVPRDRFEVDRARALFRTALRLYEGTCRSVADANNLRVNLALLALKEAPEDARFQLDAIEGAEQPEARLWRQAIAGQLALSAGELSAATARFEGLLDEARQLSQESLEWQALLGLGMIAERRGPLGGAIARYREAESVLARQSLLVPVNQGRRFLLEDRTESSRRLVTALLRTGDDGAAMDAARRARRRTVRALAARDALALLRLEARKDWARRLEAYRSTRKRLQETAARAWQVPADQREKLEAELSRGRAAAARALDEALAVLGGALPGSAADLPAPAPDTALVMPYRLQSGGAWNGVLFIAYAGRTHAHWLDHAPGSDDWSMLLRRFAPAAHRIRVLADPPEDRSGPEHANLGDGPLAARIPIAYALDLDRAPKARTSSAAVLVFDPRGDLVDARREGKHVAEVLAAQGRRLSRLGPGQATPARVLEALQGAELFHFAGHGRFAGAEGWQSALLLHDGELDLGDLATLPNAPKWVVLTGCETARTEIGASAGLGLGQVLVAAGTEVAVATRAPVPSDEALRFSEALYRGLGERQDLERAFAMAVAELEEARIPWGRFLLLTRSP